VLAATAGCGVISAEGEAAQQARVQRTVAALTAAGDADSLATAAALSSTDAYLPERAALLARAAAAAPDRTDLAWLLLRVCFRDETCNLASAEARLRALDPHNGAALVGSLLRQHRQLDPDEVGTLLARIAGSERYDLYWNPTIFHMADAISRTRTMTAEQAVAAANAIAYAVETLRFEAIAAACKGEALEKPARKASCRQIAAVFRRSDTFITEVIGLMLSLVVWPKDSAQYQEAHDQRRKIRYRMMMLAQLDSQHAGDERYLRKYLERLSRYRTQQEATLAALREAGVDPDPPADWKDPTPDTP
jgi:hypothetical protein